MTFYTTQEVADMLKVTQQTIFNLLWSGKLKGYKVGNVWRIRDIDINEYLGIKD